MFSTLLENFLPFSPNLKTVVCKLFLFGRAPFPPKVFYPLGELSAIFTKFKNCCLQSLSVRKSPKFVIWERIKVCEQSNLFDTMWTLLTTLRKMAS